MQADGINPEEWFLFIYVIVRIYLCTPLQVFNFICTYGLIRCLIVNRGDLMEQWVVFVLTALYAAFLV